MNKPKKAKPLPSAKQVERRLKKAGICAACGFRHKKDYPDCVNNKSWW